MNEIEHIKTLPCILLAFFALFTLFMVSRLIISYGVNLLYSAGYDLRYRSALRKIKPLINLIFQDHLV